VRGPLRAAGWGEDDALEAVAAFTDTIDQLAWRIENVLVRDAAEQPAAA
jgi:hypothetical protein